jgi:ribosomal protein S18 acetylase RimI-like enzyme
MVNLPPGYRLSHDPADLQMDVIHGYLARSYWSPGIPRHVVEKAVRNSLTAGVYAPSGAQVGFARMITDHTSFGYLADVFVLEEHRRLGLAHALTRSLLELPEAQGFRTLLLATRDAHALYEDCGFRRLQDPDRIMEIRRPGNFPPPDPGDLTSA